MARGRRRIRHPGPRGGADLGGLAGGYVTLYIALAPAGARQPANTGEVVTFVREIVGSTLLPGLLGGPWEWVDVGEGPPVTGTPEVLRWVTWIAFLALVIVTVSRRRIAARAWLLLALDLSMTVVLLATDWPADLSRALSGLADHAPEATSIVVVADAPSHEQATALEVLEAGGGSGGLQAEVVWTSERLGGARRDYVPGVRSEF